MLGIPNQPPASRLSDFEITRSIMPLKYSTHTTLVFARVQIKNRNLLLLLSGLSSSR